MTQVFLYAKPVRPKVFVKGAETELKTVNSKWIRAEIKGNEFQVEIENIRKVFRVKPKAKYAVFNEELLEIVNSPKRILMVADLDHTLNVLTDQARSAYESFVKFWICHFEFNGSKLVYNTGKTVEEYARDKALYYEPDLVVLLYGNFACKFSETGELVLLDSFPEFLKTCKDQDWDVRDYFEEITEKFSLLRPYFLGFAADSLLFRIPRDLMIATQQDIKNYVKNKERKVVNGRCWEGKVTVSHQDHIETACLRISPKYSGKETAVRFAQLIFGFIDEETFTAGASMSDRDAFKIEPIRGVVAANAEENLIDWLGRKKRENLYLSTETFASALVDFLTRFLLEDTRSTVFIYRDSEAPLNVTVNGQLCDLKRFKQKWAYFLTESKQFTVDHELKFEIPRIGRFAVYKSKLIPIKLNLFNLLLVSDLDGTIFNETYKGLKFYDNFIKFWITFYEFNSSVLVYNTGRNIPDYGKAADKLFRPDLLLTCLSCFAHVLNPDLILSQDPSFDGFRLTVPRHDWNSEVLVQVLQEKFGFQQENFLRKYETYILAKVGIDIVSSNLAGIKSFLKNKDNLKFAGFTFKGKVRVLKLGMKEHRFLEIIPLFVGKGFGVRFSQIKFSFESRFTFVAGDSPNDIDAFKTEANCIAMLNSEELLKEWIDRKTKTNLVITQAKWAKGLQLELGKRLIE